MIHSVLKAIDVLELFSPEEPRLTLSEIGRRLDLPKSTTHHLLNTLAARAYVEKCEDGRYALGAAVIPLTQSVRINVELRDLAAPVLRSLAEASRESVYLTTLDGDYALYIYAVESPDRLRARTAVGDRVHLHCTAVGKAMLSLLDKATVAGIAGRVGLPRFTATTFTDVETLLAELERTAQRGYAVDNGEHEANYYCIGAPICDRRGRVLGACSLSGTDPEILFRRLPELSGRVLVAAQEISRYMGYLPPRAATVTGVDGNHARHVPA